MKLPPDVGDIFVAVKDGTGSVRKGDIWKVCEFHGEDFYVHKLTDNKEMRRVDPARYEAFREHFKEL